MSGQRFHFNSGEVKQHSLHNQRLHFKSIKGKGRSEHSHRFHLNSSDEVKQPSERS